MGNAIVSLVVVVGLGSAAWAQGVGGNSPVETTHLLRGRGQVTGPKEWEVHVGSTDARLGVELDPAGPSWLKHFVRSGSPSSMFPWHEVYLFEHLVISGEQSWTGWTQQIDAGGFSWALAQPFPNTRILANGTTPAGLSIETDGSILRFSFDPLPPGTEIDIFAGLLYSGTYLPDSFDLRQSPVPEPSSVMLIAPVVVLLARGRRRTA